MTTDERATMTDTPNLALPYILPSQAQKHVTHNEAIRALDCLVQLAVESRMLTAPPASPAEGSRYLVAAAATGDWSGHSEKIAAFQDGAWMFYEPREGWIAWVADDHELAIYSAGAWAAFTSGAGGGSGGDPGDITELDDLAHLGINATADTTNRLALKSPASLFDNDGAGHQQKINKHAAGDTASVLYQTNYSGRAEMGLTGDDDFHFKVSPDGAAWKEVITIDRATGRASFPNTGTFPAYRNRVVNPTGRFIQAGLASTADGAYTGFDQWLALTQSAAVTPSRLTDVQSGLPYMMRMSQPNATAQRMGWLQPLEAPAIRDMRNKTVALQFQTRLSAAATLRYAIVEWTGTADSITMDVVNDWTSGTFTPGNFFNASNLTIAASGSIVLSANTITQTDLLGSISAAMNNILLFVWTSDAQAQSVMLDLGNVWFGLGASAPAIFEPPDPVKGLADCQRFYRKSYEVDTPPGTATTAGCLSYRQEGADTYASAGQETFGVQMRATPTATAYSPATGASGKVNNNVTGDVNAQINAIGATGIVLQVLNVSTYYPGANISHYTASARL